MLSKHNLLGLTHCLGGADNAEGLGLSTAVVEALKEKLWKFDHATNCARPREAGDALHRAAILLDSESQTDH